MDNSGKLIIMCGKVASGKTTFARAHAADKNWMYLSVDEWMLGIHGRDVPCSKHPSYIADILEQLYKEIRKMLSLQLTVVLDFGFWTKGERDRVREAIAPFDVEFYYVPIDGDEQQKRLLIRNERGMKQHDDDTYIIDLETLNVLNQRFESPVDEGDVTLIQLNRQEERI